MAKFKTTITLDLEHHPSNYSKSDLRAYINDAVRSWGGQFHPDDVLFYGFKKVTCGKIETVE